MKQYPAIQEGPQLLDWARQVSAAREQDRAAWNTLPQVFISGRKVAKVPTSSADVAVTDRAGDVNWDATYIYYAVVTGGNLVWRRVASSSW